MDRAKLQTWGLGSGMAKRMTESADCRAGVQARGAAVVKGPRYGRRRSSSIELVPPIAAGDSRRTWGRIALRLRLPLTHCPYVGRDLNALRWRDVSRKRDHEGAILTILHPAQHRSKGTVDVPPFGSVK